MTYHPDYFKDEAKHIYPQLTLSHEEYLRFLQMCEYLDHRLRGSWSYFIFKETEAPLLDCIILDNQMISVITPHDVKVVEKFYYMIYMKYLEEKIVEMSSIIEKQNVKIENLLITRIPLQEDLWPHCEHCQKYHYNNHAPIISGWKNK
jgi:hypothetical protein